MAAQEEVTELLGGIVEDTDIKTSVNGALQEVRTLLTTTKESFTDICLEIENASNKNALKAAFRRFNRILQMLVEAAPNDSYYHLCLEALIELKPSPKLLMFCEAGGSILESCKEYKSAVMQELAVLVRRQELQQRLYEEKDDLLFSQFLPDPSADDVAVPVDASRASQPLAQKRTGSQAGLLGIIPKKSKIPALAGLSRISDISSSLGASKKRILLTREKLRAGLHDPKGLLDLVGPSTNALERTKKLELLKSSGLLSSSSQKDKSFSDKFMTAALSLDLGLAGHSVEDTLLFGAKVLSTPGSLTATNISEIENNIVEGEST